MRLEHRIIGDEKFVQARKVSFLERGQYCRENGKLAFVDEKNKPFMGHYSASAEEDLKWMGYIFINKSITTKYSKQQYS